MKKVLWLVSWYPSRLDEFNGDFIQRHAMAVSQYCDLFVLYVVKDEHGNLVDKIEESDAGNLHEKIIYYQAPKTGIKLLDQLLSQRKYNRLYRNAIRQYINQQGKPDLVHVHVAMKSGIPALWAKKKWHIPFIVTEHWTGYYKQSVPSIHDYNLVFRRFNKTILEEASLFLPVTKDLGETVKREFADVPYQAIPNVVNTKLFYYKPFTPPKFRFVHFSYMHYQKDPEGILNAARLLNERGFDFELLMIGREDSKLISKSKNDGLDEIVTFHTAVPYPEVGRQMQIASACLLFSRFENLPCVILEALCCGIPVVSSNVGGIGEVINRNNGLLVQSGNVTQLADAMQQVMENYSSYNRQQIADDAKGKFCYATVGAQYLSAYDTVVPQR